MVFQVNDRQHSAGTIVESQASVAYRRTRGKKKEKSGGHALENFATIRSASSLGILSRSPFHVQVIVSLLPLSFKFKQFFQEPELSTWPYALRLLNSLLP